MSNLSAFLTEHGKTQREFAAEVGVDPSIVSRLIKRTMKPSLDLAVAIERATAGEIPAASWATARTQTGAAE